MPEARSPDELFLAVVGAIAVIVLAARLVALAFRRIGQPAVLGEVVAGILLGPSLLGLVAGGRVFDSLFPADIQPFLRLIAQLGLVFFMFLVGLQLDHRLLRRQGRAAVAVSLTSIVVPFVLGIGLGLAIHPGEGNVPWFGSGPIGSSRWPFALFLGLSVCGSAFAILARILSERGIFQTRVGSLLMGSAAVDDIVVWSLAAVVLAVSGTEGERSPASTLGLLVAFALVLFLAVRPLLVRTVIPAFTRAGELRNELGAVLLLLLLGAALVTTWIGVQGLLGAFLFGAAVPRDPEGKMVEALTDRIESISVLLLLPVFFAVTGFAVDLTDVGGRSLLLFALVFTIAVGGKLAGASVTARLFGLRGRRALAVGVLMNTRGLTELAIVSLALSQGAVTSETYTALVLTAVVSTLLASRVLDIVYPKRVIEKDIADAEAARLRLAAGRYRVAVVVDDVAHGEPLVAVATRLAASEEDAEVVLLSFTAMHRPTGLGFAVAEEFVEQAARMEELDRLASPFRNSSARIEATALLTRDPAADLQAQLQRVEPDAVMLSAAAPLDLLGAAFAHEGSDVAVLVARGDVSAFDVAVVPATGDVEVVAEIVGRLAIGGNRRVSVVPGTANRGLRSIRRALEDAALTVDEVAAPTTSTLAVVPLGEDWTSSPPFGSAANQFASVTAGGVLVVRPRSGDTERPTGLAALRDVADSARRRAPL